MQNALDNPETWKKCLNALEFMICESPNNPQLLPYMSAANMYRRLLGKPARWDNETGETLDSWYDSGAYLND